MKSLLLLLMLWLTAGVANGQSYFLKAGFGYNMPLSDAQHLQLSGFPYSGSAIAVRSDYIFNVNSASLNAGNNACLSAGYWCSRYVGMAVDISAGFSNKRYSTGNGLDIYPEGSTTFITQYAKMPLILTPSLVMRTGGKECTGYVQVGVALPVSRRIYTESETWQADTMLFADRIQLKTSFSVGLSGTAGVKYRLDDHFSICAELHALALSVYAKRAELVESKAYGQDVLYSRTEYERVTEYTKDYDPYFTYDENSPRPRPRFSVPFSSLGVQLGIWYEF
jgi:hypothetical protein